jgi:predicted nuclease with TOPRIM domain
MYGSKIWHSKDKYRKVVWQCNGRYVDRYHKCPSPNLTEAKVKQRFVKAVNQLVGNKDEIIKSFEVIEDSVFYSSNDEAKLKNLETERLEIIGDMDQLAAENASMAMDQAVYQEKYRRLSDRYHEVENQISEVTEFSDHLWLSLTDHAEVQGKDDIWFTFKNGMEIKV